MKALPVVLTGLALALSACSGVDTLPNSLPPAISVVVADSVLVTSGLAAEGSSGAGLVGETNTSDVAVTLATMLVQATTSYDTCFSESGQIRKETLKKYLDSTAAFVVSFDGNVLRRPTRDVLEGDPFTVAVVGPRNVLPLMRVGQVSAGDPDVVRYFGKKAVEGDGEDNRPSASQEPGSESDTTCGSREIRLGDFAAGAETFTLAAALAGQTLDVATIPFSVARRYVGTLTFGGVHSWLEIPSYSKVPVTFDSLAAPYTLAEDPSSVSAHIVVGFAPAIFRFVDGFAWGARPVRQGRFAVALDGFVGVSATDPFDNLFVGGSINLNNLFHIQVGAHVGNVRVIPEAALSSLEGEQIANGFDYETLLRDDWRTALFVGVSIDAASASAAFAKGIRGLLGTP